VLSDVRVKWESKMAAYSRKWKSMDGSRVANVLSCNATGHSRWRPLNFDYSACTQDINEIPTAIPMFSGSIYQMKIVAMFNDQTGRNRKLKIQDEANKLKVFISRLGDKTGTQFLLRNQCFPIQQSNGKTKNVFLSNRKWKIQNCGL